MLLLLAAMRVYVYSSCHNRLTEMSMLAEPHARPVEAPECCPAARYSRRCRQPAAAGSPWLQAAHMQFACDDSYSSYY